MLMQYIADAGPLGKVLVGLSMLSVAVIMERIWFWIAKGRPVPQMLRSAWLSELRAGRIPEVGDSSPEARAVQYLCDHYHTGDEKILDVALSREVRETNRFLAVLDTNSAIAPMLGILGTVVGIIQAFAGMKGDAPDTGVMVSGISVAMLTTAMGLVVALVSIISFNLLASRAHKRQLETAELLQEAWIAYKPVEKPLDSDEQSEEPTE